MDLKELIAIEDFILNTARGFIMSVGWENLVDEDRFSVGKGFFLNNLKTKSKKVSSLIDSILHRSFHLNFTVLKYKQVGDLAFVVCQIGVFFLPIKWMAFKIQMLFMSFAIFGEIIDAKRFFIYKMSNSHFDQKMKVFLLALQTVCVGYPMLENIREQHVRRDQTTTLSHLENDPLLKFQEK
jgi:hypothetical protein